MIISRVPEYESPTFMGMRAWFKTMAKRGLLFHPDDAPDQILEIPTGQPTFSLGESRKLDTIMDAMFRRFGNRVYKAAYPVFMKEFRAMTKR